MKLEFSLQIFGKKHLDIKFNENPSSGNRVDPRGRTDRLTDRYDEANSHFSQICENLFLLVCLFVKCTPFSVKLCGTYGNH